MSSPSTETVTSEQPTPQTVSLESLTPVQSLNVLWSMLNNASGKGAFTIDESYVLKVIFQKISAIVAPDGPPLPPTTLPTSTIQESSVAESNDSEV